MQQKAQLKEFNIAQQQPQQFIKTIDRNRPERHTVIKLNPKGETPFINDIKPSQNIILSVHKTSKSTLPPVDTLNQAKEFMPTARILRTRNLPQNQQMKTMQVEDYLGMQPQREEDARLSHHSFYEFSPYSQTFYARPAPRNDFLTTLTDKNISIILT